MERKGQNTGIMWPVVCGLDYLNKSSGEERVGMT